MAALSAVSAEEPDPNTRGDTRVLVVGQGYVGLPVAMRAVEVGYQVAGFDLDVDRVKRLLAGDSFVEDVDSSALAAALAGGRYRASTSPEVCEGFDVAVITVPTPLRDSAPDLSFIESAARTLAPFVRHGCTVVLESTTYPGTTEELMTPILEEGSGLRAGTDFHVGYSPERIDPGNRVHTFVSTPKVISGIDGPSLAAVQAFYGSLVDRVVPVGSCKVAELTKLLENTFRHVNVALVNELAMFAADLGIDVWEAIDAASTKPFGYMRFTPGPGVGGHCLPIDPSYLSWRVRQRLGKSFRFVELANDVNDHMPEYVVQRLMHGLNRAGLAVRGSTLLLLGLAYKRNSSDARESPAVVVAQRLLELGADVRAVDAHLDDTGPGWPSGILRVELDDDTLGGCDAVVVLTDHGGLDYAALTRSGRYVLDTRRCVPAGPSVEYL